ncbi:Dps family protein [Paenibacillus xylaniclasticus]|uniref:Dps family protein n=1 Tax=Paenibacillus xylaniclasticus TaxID=588083 RepID=UPI000FD872B4|nr:MULTISPECIES: DNA starvation/stationary phase protection protein [Paenibacillus]GFN32704.1 general stress protein 20U [Paenibacillus curdlanolyticus]
MGEETIEAVKTGGGEIVASLNGQLADWSVLYVKLHDYHWHVKGPNFYTLHAKFEELYTEAAAFVDEVAERILALGGKPASTMKRYLEMTSVAEAAGNEDATAMVRSLVIDFTGIVERLKQAAELADAKGDGPTADMLITRREQVQKHLWMLRAFLG